LNGTFRDKNFAALSLRLQQAEKFMLLANRINAPRNLPTVEHPVSIFRQSDTGFKCHRLMDGVVCGAPIKEDLFMCIQNFYCIGTSFAKHE